jgi:hypothetical protein
MKPYAQVAAVLCLAALAACEQQQAAVETGTGPGATGPAATQTEPDAAVALARDFETVAFAGREDRTLRRMRAPLTMTATTYEDDAALQRATAAMTGTAQTLQLGAGVPVGTPTRFDSDGAPTFGPDQRGFWLVIENRDSIATMLGGTGPAERAILDAGCGSMDVAGPGGEPFGAIIFVDARRPRAAQDHCLYREMFSNMGLAGFLSRQDSIFSDRVQVASPSARDLLLIRMLYDPRLRNGMTPAQVRPLLPQIATDALAR